MDIFIVRGERKLGPFSEQRVREMLDTGMLTRSDLAWKEGYSNWVSLDTLLGIHDPPPIPHVTPLSEAQLSTVSARELARRKGIGGWLVFFCIGLTILGPLFTIGQMVSNWEKATPVFSRYPNLMHAVMVENTFLIAVLIYGIIVGCLIWSGRSTGRRIARHYLWTRLGVMVVGEFIVLGMIANLPSEVFGYVMGAVIGGLLVEGAYFLIWYFYFKKSKRVHATYGPESTDGANARQRAQLYR